MTFERFLSGMISLLTALLLLSPIGLSGTLIEGSPSVLVPGPNVSAMDTGSRAGENVTISGWVRDNGGSPPAWAIIVAANTTDMGIVNWTITTDGNYALGVQNGTTYSMYMVPFSGEVLEGYELHGFFPMARFVTVDQEDVSENFTIQPAYELILNGTGPDHQLVDSGNFTNSRWSSRMNDTASFAIWSEVSNGTALQLPSVLIPLGEKRDLWFQWEVKGFGRSVLRMDNFGNGYMSPVQGGEIVDVNHHLAFSQLGRMQTLFSKYTSQGYFFSNTTQDLMSSAMMECERSNDYIGIERLNLLNKCTAESILSIEGMERDKALEDIEVYRKGDVLVRVLDSNGLPMNGVELEYNQTNRDFLFGVFDPVKEAGIESYQMLRDIGVNYATMGFYWHGTEPTEGNIPFDDINSTWGINELHDMGFTLKAHALIYLMDLVMPDYMKTKTFAEINASVYTHVHTLVDAYKDRIDIWNVINEANSKSASLDLTRSEVTEIIRTGVKAIRDADPEADILVNNGFEWFGQSRTAGFLIKDYDNFTIPVHEYMDLLEEEGIDYDIVGTQMYNGGWSDFFKNAGLAPKGFPVTTFDLGFISYVFDQYHKYGKPIHMTELSVSSEWNDTWKDAGYWHAHWNETVQADFLREFYTIGFSKQNVEALTWWDLDDNTTFLNGGGLFDNEMKPKEAFYALRDLLEGWTTNGNGTTNESGELLFRGFGGDYNMTVKWKNVTKDVTFHVNETEVLEVNVTLEDYALRPDLLVYPWELVVVTEDFLDTGNVYINMTVNNKGERDATNASVRFMHGNLTNGTVIGQDRVIPELEMGEYYKVDTLWNATGLWGFYNVTVVVDPDDDLNELNESNNVVNKQIELPPPLWGWLRGEVLDNGTLAPLTNATVVVTNIDEEQEYSRMRTGDDGGFGVDNISIGCYEIDVTITNYYSENTTICIDRAETEVVQILMDRITTGNIIGTVFDTMTGSGVEGATVLISEMNLTTETNLGGGYSFFGVEQGNYTLEARAKGFVSVTGSTTVVANSSVSLDFHLTRDKGTLKGNVTNNKTGGVVPNAILQLTGVRTIGEIADGGGCYVFQDISAGTYELSVSAKGFYPTSLTVDILPNTTTYQDVFLEPKEPAVDPNGTVSGFILDNETKKPIKKARVHLVELDRIVLTDDEGGYNFNKVPPGNYTIEVHADKYKIVSRCFELLPQEEEELNIYLMKKEKDKGDMEQVYGLTIVAVSFGLILLLIIVLLRRLIKRKMARAKERAEVEEDEPEEDEERIGENE
jgi:GH35 family endo-1,4-beta-xylanase